MTGTPIRVMVVDDHRFFRDGLRMVLTAAPDIELVGEAGTGEEAVAMAPEAAPHVILMDIQLPGMNGIEATRRLVRDLPAMGVIMLTMFEDTDTLVTAMRAGARGYILKDAGEEELLRSIRAVANGEALFGPAVAKRLLTFMSDASAIAQAQHFPELTDREREIVMLLARGLSNEELAARMGLSLKTVRNHVSSILAKLGVATRQDLIERARKAGLA